MQSFNETRFLKQLDDALAVVKTVLQNNRDPTFPANISHTYGDKYALVCLLTNTALASVTQLLGALGLSPKNKELAKKWSLDRSVTLRFASTEKCKFAREEKKKKEGPSVVTKVTGARTTKVTEKVVVEVIEYFWKYELKYQIYMYRGNNPQEQVLLAQHNTCCELTTLTNKSPRPSNSVNSPIDVAIGWLFSNMTEELNFDFKVDRLNEKCRTPRRNPNIEEALKFFSNLYKWADRVVKYFVKDIFPIQKNHNLNLKEVTNKGVFCPVLPLFEKAPKVQEDLMIEEGDGEDQQSSAIVVADSSPSDSGAIFSFTEMGNLLEEQMRTLNEKLLAFQKMFPHTQDKKDDKDKILVSFIDANIVLVLQALQHTAQNLFDGVDWVEHLLKTQLVASLGKVVTPTDFTEYMIYHSRIIFKPENAPRPFSYAIRQPDHYPEGTIGIETTDVPFGAMPLVINTIVRHSVAKHPMKFPISASAEVSFKGDRYLHAYVSHQFSGSPTAGLNLVARARQFSSFVLLAGTVVDQEVFSPKCAIIIQNKDDLLIPLILETIPSPKEFKDAISSLSPEQQRFAKSFRSLQLSNTLFAICVLQIKPQLEVLLKLPSDSLLKEIKLTQDIIELFLKYSIPCDMLSYDGDENFPVEEKVKRVQKHVEAIQSMIVTLKEQTIEDRERDRDYSHGKRRRQSYEERDEDFRGARNEMLSLERNSSQTKKKRKAEAVPYKAKRSRVGENSLDMDYQSHSSGMKRQRHDEQQEQPQQPQQPQQQQEHKQQQREDKIEEMREEEEADEDFSRLPQELDEKFLALDTDNSLRPTIVTLGTVWTRSSQDTLLSQPKTTLLSAPEQEEEKKKAFDLLDALSRSGNLPFKHAELHVFLASTHCFDKSLMDTVIQDNVNPIEKMERSLLILGGTVHRKEVRELLKAERVESIKKYSPSVFLKDKEEEEIGMLVQ